MSEAAGGDGLRPRFCPQCSATLVIGSDGERERRGCRRCGWIYDPPARLAVVALIEADDGRLLRVAAERSPLPNDHLRWGESPAAGATRVARAALGSEPGEPRFLGFIHTGDTRDPERFVVTFCYVLQCEAPARHLRAGSHMVRLRDLPVPAGEPERYALDAYRAWLDRQA